MKYGSFHFLSILQEPAPPCPELDLTFLEAFSKCIASAHTKNLHTCVQRKLLYEKIQSRESKFSFCASKSCLTFSCFSDPSICLEFSRKCLCFAPEIPEQSYPILRSRGKAYQTLNEGGGEVTCTEYDSCQHLLNALPFTAFNVTYLVHIRFHTLPFHNYLGEGYQDEKDIVQFS